MRYLFQLLILIGIIIVAILCTSVCIYGLVPTVYMCVNILFSNENMVMILESKLQSIPLFLIYIVGGISIVVLSLLLKYSQKICSLIEEGINAIYTTCLNLFKNLTIGELLILAIPVISSVYFALTIPVSYDEAMTYNLFTSKPFFYAAIFYPYPNNHVLHSLITNVFDCIPYVSTLFSMRLPAILSNLLTWVVALSFFKRYFSKKVAMNAVGLASIFYMTIYYSFMSRGYAFMVLCFVICFYAYCNIVSQNNNNLKNWVFFILASILGLYTIPSFLYPLATINLLALTFNLKNFKYWFISNAIIGIATLLLYSPIILIDGYEALANNQFVQKISRLDILKGIIFFYRGMIGDIIGTPYFLSFFLLIPTLLVWKDKRKLITCLIIILAPFILIFLHAVNPFYRTFLYYNFLLVVLLSTSLAQYIEKIPIRIIYLYILVIQLFSVYHFSQIIGLKEGFNTDVHTVVQDYFDPENTIIFPCIASANYEFEAKTRGLESRIQFQNKIEASADTILSAQYVIIEKGRDRTKILRPYAQSNNQNIYKIND